MILSAALGIALSNEKKREMKIYAQFYEFNERLILNLRYGRNKLSDVAEEFDYVKRTMNGEELIKGREGAFLKDYLAHVGETDAVTQIEYLNEKKQTLAKYKQNGEENYKKYGSLYFKLCLLGGILIAVLLA